MSTLKITLLQQPLVWRDGQANLQHFDALLAPLSGRDLIVWMPGKVRCRNSR